MDRDDLRNGVASPSPTNDTAPHNENIMNDNHLPKKPKRTLTLTDPEAMCQEFSHHQLGVARINNGSFGSCPASVLAAQRLWQHRFLQQPDDFYFNTLKKGIFHSRTLIKTLINAEHVDEVSLVDNTTTAAAIVLQQIGRGFEESRFKEGDTIVLFNCAFQAVRKSIEAYVLRAGGRVVEVELPFPVSSNKEIVDAFRSGLVKGKENGKRIRLAIIDHITSMPSVLVPVKELVSVCREEGVDQVFVDAAHAIGSIEIDVKDIGADFYVSNLHKWFFCPPSVAFLYSRKSVLPNDMHHLVVSHEYGNGFPIECAWIGTRDYSSQLVAPSAFEFVNRFEGGLGGIMKWNHEKVVEMGEMLRESWGTNLGSPPEMCASMVMVGLPSKLGVSNESDAFRLRSYLRVKHGVEIPVHYQAPRDGIDGPRDKDGIITAHARISHQIYNKVEDYHRLRDAINQLVNHNLTCSRLVVE